MFKRTEKNNETDLNQDVSLLADSLDDLLRSYGSKAKGDIDDARSHAQTLLKQTRAKLDGHCRMSQAARDAGQQVDSYIRDNPWYGIGIGAALGVLVGALIATGSSRR